jgi:hypothetical protein
MDLENDSCEPEFNLPETDLLFLQHLVDEQWPGAKQEMERRMKAANQAVTKAADPEQAPATGPGVPGPLEVARAYSRLEILPNPADPTLSDPQKYVMSPWIVVPIPAVDPNLWDDAKVEVLDLEDLYGTNPFLKRKNVAKHIGIMGQANSPFRNYAMVAYVEGKPVIIDGHHRLMATWLLGQESAPAYTIRIG